MQTMDEQFLQVHPRTARWWEERELCRQCVHVRRSKSGAWNCTTLASGGAYGKGDATCIRVRELPNRCGPEGKFFTPRVPA